MPKTSNKTIMCHNCKRMECRLGYPDGIPFYCISTKFKDVIERTKGEYSTLDAVDIYKASVKVVTEGFRKWPRIQEAIEFAKELNLNKIGFASCVALVNELALISELFIGAGFCVISAACQVGRVTPEDRGLPEVKGSHGTTCNPIAQAEIFNNEGTELNFILGLCLGHDILFTQYSKAPVSTLIVKDRVTGHNPAAVLYTYHQHQNLLKTYCEK